MLICALEGVISRNQSNDRNKINTIQPAPGRIYTLYKSRMCVSI